MKTILLAIFLAAWGVGAAGQSLWEKNPPGNLYCDTKARAVGDLLTVLIDEKTEVSKDASRTLDKEHSVDLSVDAFRLFGLNNNGNSTLPAAKWDSAKDFDGQAQYSSTDSFTKRLAVTVKEVLANGNLLIEGRRQMNTDGDETIMTITGIVRPEDIRADNSVPSEVVADAKITYEGDGPTASTIRRGWFLKILDAIWPF